MAHTPPPHPDGFATPSALQVLLTREQGLRGADGRDLQRGADAGALERIRRGVFLPSEEWRNLDGRARHLMRMRAVAETRHSQPVYSHVSAAALWGLPIIGHWSEQVHLLAPFNSGARSKNGVIWHHDAFVDDDVVELDGVFVTSLQRTLIDLARTSSFLSAVASLDHGTRRQLVVPHGSPWNGVPKEVLLERLAREGKRRGSSRARAAVAFSDNRSGSPGESLSRGQIHLCDFPPPLLQVAFERSDGGNDVVDFDWPDFALIGEFDGKAKYRREEYTAGLPIEEIVWREKLREDRLRSQDRRVVRWVWDEAMRRATLRAILLKAGLRPAR
ncbi:hypothetical protein [Luethyella okanaganae]|uniref:Transcriptional regulator, AbiEi antitoxin, Type IV TA system n=1 Tax=Luethyella okanaganae TaxID=69372 RepID=A0ABW1VGS8_9MICO